MDKDFILKIREEEYIDGQAEILARQLYQSIIPIDNIREKVVDRVCQMLKHPRDYRIQ